MSPDEAFRRAAEAHAAGDCATAEARAREALALEPGHADAHSLLGHLLL